MNSLTITPSGAAILAKVYESGSAAIPALASETRHTPIEVRYDVGALQDKGWVKLNPDGMTVQITKDGMIVCHTLSKAPNHLFSIPMENVVSGDIDQALEKALSELAG